MLVLRVLIEVRALRRYWNLCPRTILHVGAHQAEELEPYLRSGWGKETVWWVEAQSREVEYIKAKVSCFPHHRVLQLLAWNESGLDLNFQITNNGQSSSALALGTHSEHHPDVVVVESITLKSGRLDEQCRVLGVRGFEFINLDIQGAEKQALEGCGELLDGVQAIYCEVNTEDVYVGVTQLAEFDDWMLHRGFIRVDWEMTPFGWGDALYLRTDTAPRGRRLRRTLRRFSKCQRQGISTMIGLTVRIRNKFRRLVTKEFSSYGA